MGLPKGQTKFARGSSRKTSRQPTTELLPGASCQRALLAELRNSAVAPLRTRVRSGGVAQLVERLLCKQDVIGSNPFASTKFSRSCASQPTGARVPVIANAVTDD